VEPTSIALPDLRQALLIVVLCIGASLIAAVALLIVASRQVADIRVPEDADFFETLQHVPITVPLALDLLDMAFDIFAAPISWIILELMGLQALQMVTVLEGLIPGTQIIPTLTLAWVGSRLMKNRRTALRTALQDYQRSGRRGTLPASAHTRRRSLPDPHDDVIEGEYYEEDWGDEPPPEYYDDEDIWN
jgi:hypothetical protein